MKRLRFSVRSLLVLMTIGCVWLGVLTVRARRQKEAVEQIRRSGGRIWFDWQFDDADGPAGPRWLHQLIGEDYFQSVASVTAAKKKMDISYLVNLPDIEGVSLKNCGIRDVSVLEHLPNLKWAYLPNNEITDCSPLLGLQHLEVLDIQGNPINA